MVKLFVGPRSCLPVFVLALVTAIAAADEVPKPRTKQSSTLARVFAAWKARQERVKSFHAVWDTRIVFPKGAYSFPLLRGLAGLRSAGAKLDGERDLELTLRQSEWWGEGADRLRSEFGEVVYDDASGWKEQARFRLSHDGSLYSRLYVLANKSEAPTLAIWRDVSTPNLSWWLNGEWLPNEREVDLGPLRFALRPLRPTPEWSSENCRVISENAMLGNVPCIKIQMDEPYHSERCWIDPGRDYSVIRWERRQGGVSIEVGVTITRGDDQEWLPAQWTWKLPQTEGGRPALLEARVTTYTINKKLPEGTFTPSGPTGTRAFDARVSVPIYKTDDKTGMLPPDAARKTLAAIAAAWSRRQAQTKSFKFTWEQDRIPLRGKPFPQSRHSVCVDGEKFADEFSIPGWTRAQPKRTKSRLRLGGMESGTVHQSKTAFDGLTRRGLSLSDSPRNPCYVTIDSTPPRTNKEAREWEVLFVFRPIHPRLGRIDATQLGDPSQFRVLAERAKIGDAACVVIQHELREGWTESYWLDPARDYLPLRQHETVRGQDFMRVDLSYRPDGKGWIPAGWTETLIGSGGEVLVGSTSTVTSFAVNQPIPASEFEIAIPPGAHVEDTRGDAEDAARDAKLAAEVKAGELKQKPKMRPLKPIYDPFADAAADVQAALKAARETKRRVLIEFGAGWCPGCCYLGVLLKENAEIAAAVKKGFVMVLVDIDYESGRKMHGKYVPESQRNSFPHLAVLDSDGQVLANDDTTDLTDGEDFDIAKVKAFLARWTR